MSIRKIRKKERLNGMKYCTFCKPERVDAVYRDYRLNFACEQCKHKLSQDDNTEYTEADYQTWLNL